MSDYQKQLMQAKPRVDEENGWIHSYADLMTLLLGFFIIMYSFSKFDDKKFDDITKEFVETFKGKDKAKRSKSEVGFNAEQKQLLTTQRMVAILNLESPEALFAKVEKVHNDSVLREQIKTAFDSKGELADGLAVAGREKEHYKEVILPDTALFAPGQYRLKPAAKKVLSILGRKLSSIGKDVEIEIIGHSDSSPLSKRHVLADNFTLSSARAGAVARYFADLGIAKSSMVIKGMGDLDPLVPEFDVQGRALPENRAKNRRVHIVVKKRVRP